MPGECFPYSMRYHPYHLRSSHVHPYGNGTTNSLPNGFQAPRFISNNAVLARNGYYGFQAPRFMSNNAVPTRNGYYPTRAPSLSRTRSAFAYDIPRSTSRRDINQPMSGNQRVNGNQG